MLLIAVHALEWSLVDWLGPFLFAPLVALVWLLFMVAALLALRDGWRQRQLGARAWSALLLCAFALAFTLSAPFTRWWLQADFHWRLPAREAVIAAVRSGQLAPNVAHDASLIALPAGPHVSAGGNEIVVEHHGASHYVFFYTHRGVLDQFAGFLWIDGHGDPLAFQMGIDAYACIDGMRDGEPGGQWYYLKRCERQGGAPVSRQTGYGAQAPPPPSSPSRVPP